MENKVLSANLKALERYDKALADEILRINITKSKFDLFQNKNGEYNLLKNSFALHSLEGAQIEAQKIVNKIEDIEDKNTFRIVWGLGLGYLADEFIAKSKGTVIIFEPDIELLRAVFEVVEFEKNLQKTNVFVTNNNEKLLKMLDILADRETKITVSFLSSYLALYKNEIYKTAGLVERTRGEKQANINTINRLGPISCLNTISNIDKISSCALVSSIKDIYKGKTALIASAGPSLTQNIETIKKYREKFILFAVGPSLRLLDKNGIKPDFLCMVEAADTSAQIEGIDTGDVNLIFEPFSNSYLWNLKTKNKFLFFSENNFLNDWLGNVLNINIKGNKTVGTVSYLALSSAKTLGFKKIILCGQDLAFKDGKCYAKGSAYEDLECTLNPDTNKYEIAVKDYESYKHKLLSKRMVDNENADYYVKNYLKRLNSTIYSVPGQDGRMLPTQACYAIFIKHFETFAAENKNLELINSSTGGAQILGYKNMPLEEAIKDDLNIEPVQINIKAARYDEEKIKSEKQSARRIFNEVINFFAQAHKHQEDLIKEISMRKSLNASAQKIQEKITELLRTVIKKYYKYPFIMFLCASYTNRYFDNLEKIKNAPDFGCMQKLQKQNLIFLQEPLKWCRKCSFDLSDK